MFERFSRVIKNLTVVCFAVLGGMFLLMPAETVAPVIISNRIIFVVAAVVAFFYFVRARKAQDQGKELSPISKPLMLLIFGDLFLFQVFLCINISFRTTWDPQALWYCARYAAIRDLDGMRNMASYLSIYPNNLFLVWVYSLVFYWNECVLHITRDTLNLLQIMQCLISTLTAYLIYKTTRNITEDEKTSRIALVLYILLTGISAWLVIPYSDSTGLILPVLLLFIITNVTKADNKVKRYVLVCVEGILTYASYKIKPEIVIVIVAMVIIEAIYLISNRKNLKYVKERINCVIIFIAGMILSFVLVNAATDSMGYELDPEAELGWQHFLMQGMNESSRGGNSDSDRDFSLSIATKAERDSANLQVAGNRIREMGAGRFIKLLCIKVYRAFSSGNFGFGGVGAGFYHEYSTPRLGKISIILRSIFWEKDVFEGTSVRSYYWIYTLLKQFMWVLILAMVPFGIRNTKTDKSSMILVLALLGVFVYFMLLESHPRYMLVQSPLLCICAAKGVTSGVSNKQ